MNKKLLTAVLLLIFLSLVLCSCNSQKIDIFEYKIIYAEKDGEIVSKAAEKLHSYVPDIVLASDILSPVVTKKEILIGNTDRTESQIAGSSLLSLDYTVKYENEKVIICGGSPQATANAVNYVIDCFKSDKLSNLKNYNYKHDYKIKSLKVSGTNIRSFNVISTATDESFDHLKDYFTESFTSLTGYSLREEAGALNVMLRCDSSLAPASYLIKVKAGDITLSGANAYTIKEAIDTFTGTLLTTKTTLNDGDEFSGKLKALPLSYSEYLNNRTPLYNTYYKLTKENKLTVVYFGSSVSSGYGSKNSEESSMRALMSKWLDDTFPNADITHFNSTISAGGSMLGAFRCVHDVCALDPDLVFIEFSINDVYSYTTYDNAKVYYESIIRQIKEGSPDCEIVMLYPTDQTHIRENATALYDQALAAEEIAAYYKIPSINLAGSIAEAFDYTNDSEWAKYFIDIVHPTDSGYALYFDIIKEFFETQLVYGASFTTQPNIQELPPKLTTVEFAPKIYYANELDIIENKNFAFSNESYWKTANPYSGYIYPTSENNQLKLKFTGNNVALFAEYGSENRLIYKIDSDHERIQNQRGYHPLLLATDISQEPGEHTLTMNVSINNINAPYIITALLVW